MLEGVSIIIPTYNEEKNIHKLIERIRLAFLNSGVNYELIFIDDNSADNTVLEINKCLKKSQLPTVFPTLDT